MFPPPITSTPMRGLVAQLHYAARIVGGYALRLARQAGCAMVRVAHRATDAIGAMLVRSPSLHRTTLGAAGLVLLTMVVVALLVRALAR